MTCHDPNHMEMPVQCKCGQWVELNDTRLPPGQRSGETVCQDCYDQMLEETHEPVEEE